jgi:hypothetical protein
MRVPINPIIPPPIRRPMGNAGLHCPILSLAITTPQQVMVCPKLHHLHLDPGILPTIHRLHPSGIIITKPNTSLPTAHINQVLFHHNLSLHPIAPPLRILLHTTSTELHNSTPTISDTPSLTPTIMLHFIPQYPSSQVLPHTAGLKGVLHPLEVV